MSVVVEEEDQEGAWAYYLCFSMSGFISFLNIICIEGKLDGDVESNALS